MVRDPNYNYDWSSCYDYITLPVEPKIFSALRLNMSGGFVEDIKKIVKVHNPCLYSHFLIKKAEYETRGPVHIKMLYHDTAESKVDSILKTNLDWRRVFRAKYGHGVSFSSDPHYASIYSARSNGYDRAMIVADVLIGRSIEVYNSTTLPPNNYDTTVGNGAKVYVKFYDNEFFPTHIIYYTKR